MKIIIYALGRVFEQHKEKVDWNQVVALADKNRKSFPSPCFVPVITPDRIHDLEYDFVAVFSNEFFEEIKMELVGQYFVPQDKILSWKELMGEEESSSVAALKFCRIFFRERRCRRVLNLGMRFLAKHCLIKEELFLETGLLESDAVLDSVWGDSTSHNENLYDDIYHNYEECTGKYDAVLLGEDLKYSDEEWQKIKKQGRYLLLHTRYLKNGISVEKAVREKLQRYGKVTGISNLDGFFWIVDTEGKKRPGNIAVYVVTHKNYNLQSDDFYKPLCVGNYEKKGYLTENTGDNIAYLNPKINECTALYWIWKNTDAEYIGLNHYRRYFYRNEIKSMDNYLDADYAAEILEKYDIILPTTYPLGGVTVLDQIKASMDPGLCEKAYLLFRDKIGKNQPDYLQAFDRVMEGYNAFLCNMFVTRREILDRYCEWLFSFLIEAAEEMDVEGYDNYSQRVIGFFAERMWTVWLRKNRLRIKELPYVIVK